MVKIRLLRMGRHKAPTFRLVAVDSKAKANGSYIELIGNYNPQKGVDSLNEYSAIKWLANGAQPTDTAKNLLQKSGIWAKFTELKNKKELAKYLADNADKKPVITQQEQPKKQKPKKEQPKKEEVVVEEVPVVEETPVVEEEVKVEEEPVVEETPVVEEEILEDEEDEEEDEEDEEEIEVVEEAPEIATVVETPLETVEEELLLTKAINNIVGETGIVNEIIRKTDDSTVVLTAKTRRQSNIKVKLPLITDYQINKQEPTSIEFSLENEVPNWEIEKSMLIGTKVAIVEPVEFKILVTLGLNEHKLSFVINLIINPADEKTSEIKIKNESKLVSSIDETELKKRETENLSVVSTKLVKKLDTKPSTIIVSMHHKIIEEIINDEKTTLFLKRLPANSVDRALIYCVKPIGTVIGEFTLKTIEKLPKAEAWEKYGSKSAFTKTEFNHYYHGKNFARVMVVDGFIQYKEPKTLSSLNINRGPSGFRYLK